mmetsp:Transcript_72644/g.142246  ORF Transcript_72644/g.142246 Transcript_72644/m.142246 type:complete len:146 (-) Transcript_72644:25-462(-)
MANCLEATKAKLCESAMPEWAKGGALKCVAHNNLAEMPFAVGKYYDHFFSSMTLANIGGLTTSSVNGTSNRDKSASPAKTKKNEAKRKQMAGAGDAVTASDPVRSAIHALSSVRSGKKARASSVMPLHKEQSQADSEASVQLWKR